MKKIIWILTAMIMMVSNVSCGTRNNAPNVLVLYYSQTSHTRTLAEAIQQRLGADIEEIIPAVPYDGSFQETVSRGLTDREQGILPEIQPLKSDIASYDIIFLGYPIWFGTYAPPIAAFIGSVDLTGKKVVPFCTFGSGGLDTSTHELSGLLENTEILPGYGVRAARMEAVPKELDRFLKENGYIEGEYVKLDEFPAPHAVNEEESAIFDAAVDGYRMLHAKASAVSSRPVPDGTEYLFVASDLPRDGGEGVEIKVYVTVENGKKPEFTQVLR